MRNQEFVGRGSTLRHIHEFLDWDGSHRESVLVLTGPRGVGRSALLDRLKQRSISRDFLLLPFAGPGSSPGQLALGLFRSVLEQVTGESLDPGLPVARWLDVLPPEVRAQVGAVSGELRAGAHPAQALRCLVKGIEGLARGLERQLVVALDDPDCLGDALGFPGVPRWGFPLPKYYLPSPWVRWILAPRHPGSLEGLRGRDEVLRLGLGPLARADSYHLAALVLERELRPVPRSLLWPLHSFSSGRPGYLRSLADRVLEESRRSRKLPDREAVRTAFLRELLEPMGRIGLSCRARLGEATRGALGVAVAEVLARRGPLGLESLSQLTGIGRPRVLEHLRELTHRGLLVEQDGRYRLEDPVLEFRLRVLGGLRAGEPWEDPGVRALTVAFEEQEVGGWEALVRNFLVQAGGRILPGGPFGLRGQVLCPSEAMEEAPVGYDAQGAVDQDPGLVAADLLVNGRDHRWLVEMPSERWPYSAVRMRRALRMHEFFSRSYRRTIDRLWVAARGGFSPEAREIAREAGVLTTDPIGLQELTHGLTLASVA